LPKRGGVALAQYPNARRRVVRGVKRAAGSCVAFGTREPLVALSPE
jgi:hypothetical protein